MNIEFQSSSRVLVYLFILTPPTPHSLPVVLRDSTADFLEIVFFCSGLGTNLLHVPEKQECALQDRSFDTFWQCGTTKQRVEHCAYRPAAVWFLAAGMTIPASQEVKIRAVRDLGVIVFTAARRCISSPTTTTGTSSAGKAAKTTFRRA